MVEFKQGDIIKVEGMKGELLIVSNDFLNKEGVAMCCPLPSKCSPHPIHIPIESIDNKSYYAVVEHTKMLDLNIRGYSVISRIPYNSIMNISDALQGIFEY